MAIANSLGLGGVISNAQQGNIYTTSNTSGAYQNPAMWDQDRAYRDEIIRREERHKYEQMQARMYRDEIMGYAEQKQMAPEKKVKAVPAADNFPEGREKNLLLLLEH